jgi:hypothetical protein
MANCKINGDINAIECFESNGGVDLIYIANFSDISGYTESNSLISAIDMSGDTVFYTVTPNLNSAFWTESDNGTVEANSVGNAHIQTLTCSLSKKDNTTVNNIKLMSRTRLMIIVKENDGTFFILGKDKGMILNPGRESGTLIADKSGYNLVFTSIGEKDPAAVVDANVIPTIL